MPTPRVVNPARRVRIEADVRTGQKDYPARSGHMVEYVTKLGRSGYLNFGTKWCIIAPGRHISPIPCRPGDEGTAHDHAYADGRRAFADTS